MMTLITAHGGQAVPGWWDQIRPCSLGWVTARLPGGGLVGFVKVAWDGGDHAFLLDTKVARAHQRQALPPRWSAMPCGTPGRPGVSGCTSTSGRSWQRSTWIPAALRARQPE
jgi:hypothetical protein